MKTQRVLWSVVAGALLSAGGCSLWRDEAPIVSAGGATDRRVSSTEAVDRWWSVPAAAARGLMVEYGVPDRVDPDSLTWNGNGPWRRTVVRNAAPSDAEGVNLGIIAQTVVYPLTPAQAANVTAFDGGLVYDPQTSELTARSDREDFNFLRINLADDVAHGRLAPEEARARYFQTIALEESGKGSTDLLSLRLTR